jgi:cytochrome o ubiquinol oxidase operon protein cyoD
MTGQADPKRPELITYVAGFGAALVLTCAAFGVVQYHIFSAQWMLCVVFGLALLQMTVHFRFFLHVSLKRSVREDLQLVLFSTLIILLMVGGTLVVLFNLRLRMM